jgi:ankyrin repeat protein
MLHSILKPLAINDKTITRILWCLVDSLGTHPLLSIYKNSFLDYSALCLNLAELIHLLHASDRSNMCGKIASFLLYPTFSQTCSSDFDGRVWRAIEKLSAFGANLSLPLRVATLRRKWQDMLRLIEYGAIPDTDCLALTLSDTPYTHRCPPLDLCQVLIDRGVDVNATHTTPYQGIWHVAPLIAATIANNPALVRLLLAAGANVDAKPLIADDRASECSDLYDSRPGNNPKLSLPSDDTHIHWRGENCSMCGTVWYGTALIAACARGYGEICQVLVEHGADVQAVVEPSVGRFGTALVAACAYNHPDIYRILLDHPSLDVTMTTWRIPNIPSPRPIYTNALVTAASSGGLEICRLLLERGADVNSVPLDETNEFNTQATALIMASLGGHIAVCKLLVEHGADVNIVVPGARYPTALFAAAQRGKISVGDWLLEHGAEINQIFISKFPVSYRYLAEKIDMEDSNDHLDFAVDDDSDSDHGITTFTAELASKLALLGIRVSPAVIRTKQHETKTETPPTTKPGAEVNKKTLEETSQIAETDSQDAELGHHAEALFRGRGNEISISILVSTANHLDLGTLASFLLAR